MLAIRNVITRPYWTSTYNYVCNRINRSESHKVTRDVWVVKPGTNTRTYYIMKGGRLIAWLYMTRRPQWQAWEVAQSWVFPEHRGQGLAIKLYKAAVNTDGLLLASGTMHSQYSQGLWRRFLRDNIFEIWAHNFKNLEEHCQVWYDAEHEEVISDLQIYLSPSSYMRATSDVRLLAIRRSK